MSVFKKFPKTFWVANTMEIFERMAWYGFFTVSSLYITGSVSEGALGFTSEQRGVLQGVVTFILYLLPVLTGALADRYGYRRTFMVAFAVMTPAYYLLGQFTTYHGFFAVFLLVALGAAIFKPVVVGTIARTTTEETSTVGFGIFYMMVNIGGFVGPIVAGIVRGWSWKLVFTMSSVWIGINFLWVIFFYKEPTTESDSGRARSLRKVLADLVEVLGNGRFFLTVVVTLLLLMVAGQGWLTFGAAGLVALVWIGFNLAVDFLFLRRSGTERGGLLAPMRLGDWRFALFLLVLSGFWTMFMQIFMTMPEYIRDFVDTHDILRSLASASGGIGLTGLAARFEGLMAEGYQINPEYLINIDAGAIIVFQVLVSTVMARFAHFTTMIVGTLLASVGIAMTIISPVGWVIVPAIVVFAIGEMAASPKSQEYIGRIAPPDKVAMYMGYYFVTIALGNLFGGILSGQAYGKLARDMGRPDLMWLLFAAIGVFTAVCLILYNRFVLLPAGADEGGEGQMVA